MRRTTGEENEGSVTAHKEELAARADPIESLQEEIGLQLKDFFSRILANLIMTGQIPAPTGDEKDRAKYVSERFSASGLEDIGLDSAGNVFGRLPGSQGRRTVGIFAALDTPFSREVDHHLEVTETKVIGPGVAYDSLAASTLVSLAEFLVEGNMPIKDDILFVGLAKCSNQSDAVFSGKSPQRTVLDPDAGIHRPGQTQLFFFRKFEIRFPGRHAAISGAAARGNRTQQRH